MQAYCSVGGGVIGGGWVSRCLLNGIRAIFMTRARMPAAKDEIMFNAESFGKLIKDRRPQKGEGPSLTQSPMLFSKPI
ncbi:MAG: hypothetical protein CM15mP95_2740 [Alphaproteobacteria bacterium]|nr:MAG: hypothetical protein CM15mP95_2740 [Alphaproteobacteria bacterium]